MRDRPSIQNVGLYRVPFLEAYPEVLRRTCIVMPTQAGSVDNLFLNTLKDLQTKITSNDSYQMLMAAALLRKLLIDGNSLTEQVNRNRRLRLAFTFNDKKPLDETGLIFWSIQDGFDPDTSIARLSPLTVKENKVTLLMRHSGRHCLTILMTRSVIKSLSCLTRARVHVVFRIIKSLSCPATHTWPELSSHILALGPGGPLLLSRQEKRNLQL
jgi:hypothetical protein